MRLVSLGNQPVQSRTDWLLQAMGATAAIIKVWGTLRLGFPLVGAIAITLAVFVLMLGLKRLRRRAGLCPTECQVHTQWRLGNWIVRRRSVSVAGARSVRADRVGWAQQMLAVYVSTSRDSIEVMRFENHTGHGLAEAAEVCDRISKHLGITNAGVQTVPA